MGFEVLNRRAARASGVAVNVTRNPKAKEGKGLSGMIRIAPDVAKLANLSEDTKVQILVGNGPDTGKMLLQANEKGMTRPFKPKAGASLQLSFSAVSAGFTHATGGTVEVPHDIGDDGSITITLPMLRDGAQKKPHNKKA
jgi:hypothetical protein